MLRQIKSSTVGFRAQAAVEYLLLLAVVVSIVLVGFKHFMPKARDSSELYFNRTADGILGKRNPCGDGTCDSRFEDCVRCPVDCGPCS